jgi:asparagine synthase (glutamine-hydrolysing)
MCGIAGFVDIATPRRSAERSAIARSMAQALMHRGPDAGAVWCDETSGLALAHRRLSIIDLSDEGGQPMTSACGRYTISYNGEIYNYRSVRAELEALHAAPAWRGHSDTEVLLAAVAHWGVERVLEKLNGMFAFALWDRIERRLYLARDRFGEKPLYYGWQGGSFMFGSELKALLQHPSFERTVARTALPLYFRFGYVPAPHSIYAGIFKLPPAHYLSLSVDAREDPVPRRYWSVPVPQAAAYEDARNAADELERLLGAAVRQRMESDVPLGAFLSGGIDSSAIVALAQEHAATPVRTFSIGFRESAHDEAPHARIVAAALGTRHTELYVTAEDALAVIPQLPDLYDEPFADSSQIPTYLLAKLAREHVTVALSGDGGDELFGGYNRYAYGRTLLALRAAMPASVRNVLAASLRAIPGRRWDRLLSFGPQGAAVALGGDKLAKVASALTADDCVSLYKGFVSQWQDPAELLPGLTEAPTVLDQAGGAGRIGEAVSWMMYMDQLTYLPDDILVKVDRAAMAASLETRVPFLDPAVVAFAAGLPLDHKVRGATGKWLLRQVLYRHVDEQLFARPKSGFAIPLAAWLRGRLREWAHDLLGDAMAGPFRGEHAAAEAAWNAHASGRANLQAPLWVLLMFHAWCRRYNPRFA